MKALVINGPNLNMLGKRDKDLYGTFTLSELNEKISKRFLNVTFEFFFSNFEGDLIEKLQNSNNYDFLVINPGGLAHYSVALRDAFEGVSILKGVCHLSDIFSREAFRRVDLLQDLADVYVTGLKENSYFLCIENLISKIDI